MSETTRQVRLAGFCMCTEYRLAQLPEERGGAGWHPSGAADG